MAILFRYNVLPDDFSNDTKKPVVKITLYGKNETPIDVIALLDSGADVSVIPKGLAEYLSLILKDKEKSKGIGGEINVWNSLVNISIQGGHEKYYFKNMPIQVAEDDSIPIILGRAGFFDRFIISIDEKNKKVNLKRNND